MPPKKVVPVTAAEAVVEKEVQMPQTAENSKEEPKTMKLVKSLTHPPTLSMVIEVLKKSTEKKGTSVQAIRAQILAAHPTVDPLRLKNLLKSALKKGIEKGVIIRPAKSSASGATGRFLLAKPGSKPKQQSNGEMPENVDPNAEPKKTKKLPKAKVAKQEATKVGEKAEKKVKADGKTEKPEEKPKAAANKTKKDPKVKPDEAPAAKRPKAKAAAAEEGKKAKKEPATKEKAKPAKAKKNPEETPAAKK
ncbi:protein B4-like isoform X1 [Pseudophryne corroboree]|uniref:protein B4-like isoform X1 n=1 Tax=Pseudophryne corroboree TaxID=495146 RepID=UPI0030821A6C